MFKAFKRQTLLGILLCSLALSACHQGQPRKPRPTKPSFPPSVDAGGQFVQGWWKVTKIVDASGTSARSMQIAHPLAIGHVILFDSVHVPAGRCAPGAFVSNKRTVAQEDLFDPGQPQYFDPAEAGIHDRMIYEVTSFCPKRFFCSLDGQHLYLPQFGMLLVLEHQDIAPSQP